MIARSQVHESQIRLAHHYVDLVRKANADFLSGFERSVNAVQLFDKERLQIDRMVNWLLRNADDDEAGSLLVTLMRDSYQLLYARVNTAELQGWFEHSLEVARRIGDVRAQAAHLLTLGYAIRRTTTIQHSLAWFEQAYALAQRQSDERLIVRCLASLGRCYQDQRVFDKAIQCNQKAFEISRRLGDTLGMYEYFDMIGYICYREGKFADALNAYEQAYVWALKAGGYRQIGITLGVMGDIYTLQGRYEDAIFHLRQAVDFALHTKYPPVIIYTLHLLGNTLISTNDYSGAQEAYLKALRIAEQHHLTENIAVMQAELGILASRRDDLALAVDYLEKALEQLFKLEQSNYQMVYTCFLVVVHVQRHDLTSAERRLREAIELAWAFLRDPAVVLIMWSAVVVFVERAFNAAFTPAQRLTRIESAAYWAGMVLASPHIMPENRETIRKLLQRMSDVLGDERFAQLLKDGERLDVEDAISQVRAALDGSKYDG